MLSALCQGRDAHERAEAKKQNDEIETQISLDERRLKRTIKILLLGASETGKSTVIKQMRCLHDNGFSRAEFKLYKHLILSQTASSVLLICDEFDKAGGVYANGPTKAFLAALKEQHESNKHTNTSYVLNQVGLMAILQIYKEANFQTYFKAYGNVIHGVTSFFVENCERIVDREYQPTVTDMIYVRVPTTSINEITFTAKRMEFNVVDVAGVKSARKRWLETFSDVDCVMFLAASSDFNLPMREDPKQNRLQDSLALFKQMYRNPAFAKSSFVLFLNKRDVLADKLKALRLTDYLSGYTGDNTFEDVSSFIEKQFLKYRTQTRQIFCQHTCATDTNQMQLVIDACFDRLWQRMLESRRLT